MAHLKPNWEKSFVIVNKEQRTGILCYCFSVGEFESDSPVDDLITKPNYASEKKSHCDESETGIELALRDILCPSLAFDGICCDHRLLVYKGKYYSEDVSIRILHKPKKTAELCETCLTRKTKIDRQEITDIIQCISHNYIVRPLIAKSLPSLSFVILPSFKKSLKEVIDSRQNLREGTDEDARFLTACLADAVMYLHENLIVHRNICPLTVFLSNQGDPLLGCFEQATRTRELGSYSLGSCGTLGYQSPEVVAQLGYNHTVDFWGIGCVAYEFLFGIMPYVDADVSRMLSKTVLNPDFAFTRLGGRFTRLPKAAQDALRDGFLNRYPHKRAGFKLFDAKQMRWYQPFRWDMIREKQYKSPLERFVVSTRTPAKEEHNFAQTKINMSHLHSQVPSGITEDEVDSRKPPGANNMDQSNAAVGANNGSRHVNHTAGMFDFQALLQNNLVLPRRASAEQPMHHTNPKRQQAENKEALNPLQAFIQQHFHKRAL